MGRSIAATEVHSVSSVPKCRVTTIRRQLIKSFAKELKHMHRLETSFQIKRTPVRTADSVKNKARAVLRVKESSVTGPCCRFGLKSIMMQANAF